MPISSSQPPPQPLPIPASQDRVTRRRINIAPDPSSSSTSANPPSHVPPKTRANLESASVPSPSSPSSAPLSASRRPKPAVVPPLPSPPIHGFSITSGRRVVVEAPVDCGFPPSSAQGKMLEEDLRDGALMAVCACLMASDNQAMGIKELSDLCDAKGWIRPSPSAKTAAIISSALRSHFRRRSTPSRVADRPSLLTKVVLVGSVNETVLAPALHPDACTNGRRPRGTVWYLSSDIGFPNPFERAKLSHLLPSAPAPKKGKRKRGAPAAAVEAPSSSLKIKLKMLGGVKEDAGENGGEEGEEDDEDDEASEAGTIASDISTAISQSAPTFTRRQRGPSEGFPNFPRLDHSDDDDAEGDQPSTSFPNPLPLATTNRNRRVSRQPSSSSRPLPSSFALHSNSGPSQRSSQFGDDDSSSSVSSDEDEDPIRMKVEEVEGVFGMDEDEREVAEVEGTSGSSVGERQIHQTAKPESTSTSRRRSDLPPAPTPAQLLLAGDSNPTSPDQHTHATLPPTICPPDLMRVTAPLPTKRPSRRPPALPQASTTEPAVSSSSSRQLSLPRMLGPSSPSSPAFALSSPPHQADRSTSRSPEPSTNDTYFPASPFHHSYPSPILLDANGVPLPSHSSGFPNSPDAREKDDFALRLSLLPGELEPVSLEDRHRSSSEEDERFDDSICTIEGDALSPSTSYDDDEMDDRVSQGYSRDDASRWIESVEVKLEPPSPSKFGASPPDMFSRSSSEEEEEDARMVEAIALAGPRVVHHPDEDDVDMLEQSFLGPESVGLEELERAWGGGRKGKMRMSFGGAVSAMGFEGLAVDDVVEADQEGTDSMALDEVKREKEAFAQALVDRVRAACVERFEAEGAEDSEDEMDQPCESTILDDPNHPESSTRPQSRKSRRSSNLPKPLPASFYFSSDPSSLSFSRRRFNTAPATIALPSALIDVEGFDPMDLLFTPESGVGKGSFPSQSPTKTESTSPFSSISDSDPLHLGPESVSLPTQAAIPQCLPPIIPRPNAFRPAKLVSSSTSTEPLTPVSPPLVATVVDSIPVFRCVWSSIVLLRRIDSDHVNLSPLLRAFGIISSGGEKEEEKLLRHVPGGVSVQWGEEAAAGVNGVWVMLSTARMIALEYTAGSPLLASFLDPALRSLFPSPISDPPIPSAHESGFTFAPPPCSRTSSTSTIVPGRPSQRDTRRSSIESTPSDTPVADRSPRPPLRTNNSKPAPLRSALSNAVEAQAKPKRSSGRQPKEVSGLSSTTPVTVPPPVRSPPIPHPTKATRSTTGRAQAPVSSKTTTTVSGARKKALASASVPAVDRVKTRAAEAASVRHTRRSSGALPK